MHFIHLLIDLSIALPLALANGNIMECIFLSLLVFCRGVSFCALIIIIINKLFIVEDKNTIKNIFISTNVALNTWLI